MGSSRRMGLLIKDRGAGALLVVHHASRLAYVPDVTVDARSDIEVRLLAKIDSCVANAL